MRLLGAPGGDSGDNYATTYLLSCSWSRHFGGEPGVPGLAISEVLGITMRLFHLTRDEDALSIMRDGFRDRVLETADDGQLIEGVRLFDNPIRWNFAPTGGNVLFSIEILDEAISQHEVLEDDPNDHHLDGIALIDMVREFAAPASLVNSYGPPSIEDVALNWTGLLDGIDLSGIGDDT